MNDGNDDYPDDDPDESPEQDAEDLDVDFIDEKLWPDKSLQDRTIEAAAVAALSDLTDQFPRKALKHRFFWEAMSHLLAAKSLISLSATNTMGHVPDELKWELWHSADRLLPRNARSATDLLPPRRPHLRAGPRRGVS
jgi:hypothetical protein